MRFFKDKAKAVQLTLVDKFICNHAITTYHYGNSPMRVYAMCGQCKQFMPIAWKDTRARISNRIIHSFPFIWQASVTVIIVTITIYAITTFLLKKVP